MNGIVVVDKPEGRSSARVLEAVKRLLGAKKAGHAGTLDPFAGGVLVCCLNQATRLARFLLHGDKTYEGVLRLGVETDTEDPTGAVVAQADWSAVTEASVHAAFRRWAGTIAEEEENEGDADEDVEAFIEVGEREGILEPAEGDMVRGIMDLGETLVREIMTPRTDIVAVPSTASVAEARRIALDAGPTDYFLSSPLSTLIPSGQRAFSLPDAGRD